MALSRIGFRDPLKSPVEPLGRDDDAVRPREGPLPVRLRAWLRAMRTPARRSAASETALRALASPGPAEEIAARIVELAFAWMGGQGWAVLAQAEPHGLTWLADRGITSTRRPAITALAARVVDSGEPAWSEDASALGPTPMRRPFGVLALPLRNGRCVTGVLAGIDQAAPAGADAALPSSGDLAPFGLLLDPLAAAMEAAVRLSRAEALSSIDDLTALYNSRFLGATMQRESKRALRTHRPLSLLFVDLDGFKGINDRWGHLSGSRALVEAAGRILSGARETDIVARYGGDEFAIVLPETPPAGALVVAQRVRDRICARAFLESEGINYRLTASVGAATLPDAARTPEELLAAADAAMYRVKARGKNGIEVAGAPGSRPRTS